MRKQQQQSGFILPSIIVISIAIIAVMATMLVTGAASYKGNFTTYYQKLADEAAEAGSAYATACLTLSSHDQTWGSNQSRPNLGPNTDCNGANSYPSNTYVYSDSKVRSYFAVGNLDYSTPFSAQISAVGTVQVLRPNGTVAQTFTSIQKKVISWPTEVTAQMSDSGTNRTCAIVNYQVYCWGYNGYGQLGDGRYAPEPNGEEKASIVDSDVPVKVRQDAGVMAGKRIVKIFVAQYHSCALSEDGLVYCWGVNTHGQLGRGAAGNSAANAVPEQVQGALAGKVVTDIGGTNNVSCAIAEGKIYCWGTNAVGLTGRNTTSGNTPTPTLVTASNTSTTLPTTYTATVLANSGSRSRSMCAIANAKAYCWGSNYNGALGDNTTTNRSVPTKVHEASGVLLGKTVTAISQDGFLGNGVNPAVGGSHACVIASSILYCWGDNSSGQLGNGSKANSSAPVAVTASGALSGKTIQDVKLGIFHSCARASGGMYCWGAGSAGQVGDGTWNERTTPVSVALQPGNLTASNVISIGAGSNRSCAVITDGRTFCMGLNSTGQIGDGTTTNRNVPTESLFLRPTGNQYIF